MLYNCVIIDGREYDKNFNNVLLQVYKGLIKIVGIISKFENLESIDGYKVYNSTNLNELDYDYAILMEIENYSGCVDDIEKYCGIAREKIIGISPFREPDFNFNDYIQLLKSKVTIIADNCFGGGAYHFLATQFNSPFINMSVSKKDLLKIMQKPRYYLSQQLKLLKYVTIVGTQNKYPVAQLDDVLLYMNHYKTFEEAKIKWDIRVKRVNYDNIVYVSFFDNPSEEYYEILKTPDSKIITTRFRPGVEEPVNYLFEYELDILQYNGFWDIHNRCSRYVCHSSQSFSLVRALMGKKSSRRSYSKEITFDVNIQMGIQKAGSEIYSLIKILTNEEYVNTSWYNDLIKDIPGKDAHVLGIIGRQYRDGRGVKQDLDRAAEYMRKAADKNVGWAKNELFDILWRIGTPESMEEMISVATESAEAGDGGAMGRLGRAYRDGKGVPQDLDKAAEWMRKAADKNVWWAKNELLDIQLKL